MDDSGRTRPRNRGHTPNLSQRQPPVMPVREASDRAGIAAGERRATAAAELARGRHRALGGVRARGRARARHIARARQRAPDPAAARAGAAAGHVAGTAAAPDLVAAARCPGALDLARRRRAADDAVRACAIAAYHAARDVRGALHVRHVTTAGHAAIDHADTCFVARALRALEPAQRDIRVRRGAIGRARLATIGERIVALPVSWHDAPAIATVLAAGAIGG